MLGNEILLKCDIPSFVADFVIVDGWVDSEGLGIADDGNYQGNQYPSTQTISPCEMSQESGTVQLGFKITFGPCCMLRSFIFATGSEQEEGTDNAYCPWFPQKITSSNLFQSVFSFSAAVRDHITVATIA